MINPSRLFGLSLMVPIGLLFLGIAATPAQAQEVHIIETVQKAPKLKVPVDPNLPPAVRFGYQQVAQTGGHPRVGQPGGSEGEVELHWTTPEAWTEISPEPLKKPNFQIKDNPQAQAYVTILAGDGGGLIANVNRWRRQMSLQPWSGEAMEKELQTIQIMGRPAAFATMEGTYTTRSGESHPDYLLAGIFLQWGPRAVTIKMVGPKDAVGDQIEAFKQFAASVHSAEGHAHGEAQEEASEDPHAGLDMGENHPPIDFDMSNHPPIDMNQLPEIQATSADSGGLSWKAPEAWEKTQPRPMRVVNFAVGPEGEAECYVSTLAGTAGGMEANLNRWRRQMGQPPLSPQGFEELEKIEVLGESAPLLEVAGEFSGMGGREQSGAALLGVASIGQDQSVFVKMIGPAEIVLDQKENFIAFCKSLTVEE